MSKWKRKKYQENQVDTGEEEFSPLGLALLSWDFSALPFK